jgi:hypothetical protein
MADDYDSPWKEVIERYFPDFLHFYFPHAHAQIDWSESPLFLEQELRAVVQDAELGTRFVDKLVRVNLRNREAEWIYVHLEVQGSAQESFAERMFVYNYRLYDRYHVPIASLAVLADEQVNWRPAAFTYDVLGCHMGIRFPVAKLLDWSGSEERLADSRNPFAVVTHAHLATRATRGDPLARYEAKWRLVKDLYRRGWERKQVIDLMKILDWMMRLPKELAQALRQNMQTLEEEMGKPYVTSFERLAIEEGIAIGIQQGMQQGRLAGEAHLLARLLTRRFGEVPLWALGQLQAATESELEAWGEALLSASSIEAVFSAAGH